LQGNALCKAIVPCSVSTDEGGLCGQHPTCGVSPPISFPASARGRRFSSSELSRAPALLHKNILPFGDFHVFMETWFTFRQLLSFLLFFPSWPQNTNPVSLHSSTPKPDLQTKLLQNSRNLS